MWKIVQPPEQGIVKDILFREGELVKAGQTLVRMDALLTDADQKTLAAAVRALALRRIKFELGSVASSPSNLASITIESMLTSLFLKRNLCLPAVWAATRS